MIIQLNQGIYSFRYLPQSRHRAVSLFFQGGNVAYRRAPFEAIGFFDEKLDHCEDVDAGIRLSEQGQLFSNPNARVVHTSDLTLGKVLNQWWLRSLYQVRLMKKFSEGGIEVFLDTAEREIQDCLFRCVFAKRSSFTAVLFFTPFLCFNLFAILSLLVQLPWLRTLFQLGCLVSLVRYLRQDFAVPNLSLWKRLVFGLVRLAINFILLYTTLFEGLRKRMLYFSFAR